MQRNSVFALALIASMILIGAGFIFLHFMMFSPSSETTKKTFYVEVERFKWTFYADESKSVEIGASAVVNLGDTVVLKLTSKDVAHGLWIDGYSDGELTVEYPDSYPEEFRNSFGIGNGRVLILGVNYRDPVTVTFKADMPGRFTIRCAVTCGNFHPYMLGEIKVQPHAVFYLAVGTATIIGALGIGIGYRKYLRLVQEARVQATT